MNYSQTAKPKPVGSPADVQTIDNVNKSSLPFRALSAAVALHALPAIFLLVLAATCLRAEAATTGTAWGSINNFDVVNDTGKECHGFEIEIEDLHSQDVTYTYNWNHYGTPRIIDDHSNPLHPKVIVRYESARDTNGGWAAFTAIPSGTILPTDGHQFTDPSVNLGGEHFGAGYNRPATNISYYWLVDDGQGRLVRGPAVSVATPVFTYQPPAPGDPAQVQAILQPPKEVPRKEFGTPSWVKEIRTTTHNNRQVQLRDLVTDDPEDPDDRDWRNGEPDEVEVEWELLQVEFKKADGGRKGRIEGAPQELPNGDEVVTRRYEFYKYLGPLDDESGEAMADSVGPDDVHGSGIKNINGVDVDLSTVLVVGEYLGAQMSALDAAAPLGLIEHVQDGVTSEPYPARTLVVGGNAPFVATNWGTLPTGMAFDTVSGVLAGTPSETGVFQFTVQAQSDADLPVRKSYTLTIVENAAAAADLPPRSTVDTVPSPLDGGTTGGDGTYTNGTTATVSAVPTAGFSFSAWTDNGRLVSTSTVYSFTNVVHRSLVAQFVRAPRLSISWRAPGELEFSWPTNFAGYSLQQNPGLEPANWTVLGNVVDISGTNYHLKLQQNATSGRFFRLSKTQP